MDIAPPLPSHAYTHPTLKTTAKCSAAQTAPELEHTEFLAIDDLLDFSNDDIGGPIEPCPNNAISSDSSEFKIEPPVMPPSDCKLVQPCAGFDSDSLCVPCDDLAELEWLSNFVEESFSSGDAPAGLGWATCGGLADDDKGTHRSGNDDNFRTTSPVSVLESNTFSREKSCPTFSFSPDISPVPARARSKRCRTAVCFWNTRILSPEVSESLLETASTTYAIQAASSESNMYNSYYDYDEDEDDGDEEGEDDGEYVRFHANHRVKSSPVKAKSSSIYKAKSSLKLFNGKPKKMKMDDASAVRKCLHCATQKTPQWRAGPMGPKTLCNACGVRYKSGRLCEEYRPAASPTFVETLHSNSHRKVLEMRRQRGELGGGLESQKHKGNNMHRLRVGTSGGNAGDRGGEADGTDKARQGGKEGERSE